MDPRNDPVVKFARKRLTELSAKIGKTDDNPSTGSGQGKVHEFAGRDQYGRYIDNDRGGMGGTLAGVGGAAAIGAGGLYARGKFGGSGRLRAAGRFAAPRSSGLGGVVDTATLGAKHLAGDFRKAASGVSAGFNTAAARGATATTSGKAMIASLLRRITLRGRAG